jgi:type II secretory pathway pseudopilin PulG
MKTPAAVSPVRRQQGISLFEMLMSVAIIGVMCSLALPLFGAPQEAFSSVKAKRNAQELVTECTVARAAGVDFVVASDLKATLAAVNLGARAESGVFAGREFGLKGMSPEELAASQAYLKIQNGELQVR